MINLREWALPVYTIMMQMAAGSMLILWLIYTQIVRRYNQTTADQISHNLVMVIFITISTAMVGSHFHLSRPFFSLLALINFKTSWLSREIAFTIGFAILVSLLWLSQRYKLGPPKLRLVIGWGGVIMGLMTVYCMTRVYLLPTQFAWNSIATPVAFFSATFLLGGIAVSALLLINLYLAMLREETALELEKDIFIIRQTLVVVTILAVVTAITELANYVFQIKALSDGGTSARASLDLLLGLYRVLFGIRLVLLGSGVTVLVGMVLWQHKTGQPLVRLLTSVYVTFLLLLVSEVLGRFLFYAIHVRTGI